MQREWGTSVQPLKKPTANRNKYSSVAYPYGVMNFMPALAICFQIANQKQVGALNFKGRSQNGGLTDFSENLGASLFMMTY